MNNKVIVVGAGLSGLTLAYLLSKKNLNATVLEASSRLGGRIQTIKGRLDTPLELGATWFSDMHPNLLALIDELDLDKYPQFSKGKSLFQTKSFEPPQEFFVPESENPSYRLVGGTQRLIDKLAEKIPTSSIKLDSKVIAITERGNELSVETSRGKKITASKVVLCLPPQLINSEIQFSPALPKKIIQILPTVQTWMAGSIKFGLEYERPFWRENGYSGMLYSHSGIVVEMYDHTNFEEHKFGFTGFLNGGFSSFSEKEREKLVIKQLVELLGDEALNFKSYKDKVWTDEYTLGKNQIIQSPHQNNGHPLLQKSYFGHKLYFGGTETSREFYGYMEGAVQSAIKLNDEF